MPTQMILGQPEPRELSLAEMLRNPVLPEPERSPSSYRARAGGTVQASPDNLLLMAFEPFLLPDGDQAWADDANVPKRFVARRAENRFQAYQLLDGDFLSVGYFMARADCRTFLEGRNVELMSEFGEDTDREPLVYPTVDA